MTPIIHALTSSLLEDNCRCHKTSAMIGGVNSELLEVLAHLNTPTIDSESYRPSTRKSRIFRYGCESIDDRASQNFLAGRRRGGQTTLSGDFHGQRTDWVLS